jgi:hypothetical protein
MVACKYIIHHNYFNAGKEGMKFTSRTKWLRTYLIFCDDYSSANAGKCNLKQVEINGSDLINYFGDNSKQQMLQ